MTTKTPALTALFGWPNGPQSSRIHGVHIGAAPGTCDHPEPLSTEVPVNPQNLTERPA
jgi:hypothetical protein